LRVSILAVSPVFPKGGNGRPQTNHERTLSVPYVFRNHLIWREQSGRRAKMKIDDGAAAADAGKNFRSGVAAATRSAPVSASQDGIRRGTAIP
jgi:hypothetical protein